MKCNVLREWVRDLTEQNSQVIATIRDIEKEACNKLQYSEQRLKDVTNKTKSQLLQKDEHIVSKSSLLIFKHLNNFLN